MEKKFFLMIILLISYNLFSQSVYQQTNLELNEEMNSGESYQCLATTSIKLNPGFCYMPDKGNDLSLEIDRYSVLPPVEGCYGGVGSGDNGVVGALPGTFGVSNIGAAVYSIKIETPPAIGNMKPELSLVYNNQSANGIMGWAWSLCGLSSITRTGQTLYHDDNMTKVDFINDRYVMDGQRLMMVKGSGYGKNETEYKTEIDNMDKIVSYTSNDKSPEYFIVWKSDGTIWEYGTTTDSRVETKSDNKKILKWMLARIYDRNGNAMTFTYNKNVDQGEAYIDNIQYTSNEEVGVNPSYKVSFIYTTKQYDGSFGYVNGNMVANDRLLKNIQIYNNLTGKKLFDYSLEYYAPGMYGENKFIYHRLKSIGLTVGDDKINPTKVIWNAEKKHYNDKFKKYQLNESVFDDKVPFVGDFNGDGYSDVFLVPYKIQNAYSTDVEGLVYLNNRNGGFYDTPNSTLNLSKNLEWVYVLDMNDDGIDDIVLYDFNYEAKTQENVVTLHFYTTEDDKFVKKATYTYDYGVALIPGKFMVKDDAAVLVVENYNGSNEERHVDYIRMVNNVLEKSRVYNVGDINCDMDYYAFDILGDGICELMTLCDDGYKVFKLSFVDKYSLTMFVYGSSVVKDDFLFPNDYNGDGKTDLLYYKTSRQWNIAFSKGNVFSKPFSCTNTELLRTVVMSAKDKYRYSLMELQNPSVTIRTGDFDGDGVADVGVFKAKAGNYYLTIGFKPYVKSDNTCAFAKEKRYYMPINYYHQTIRVGRFLPQENISILSALPYDHSIYDKAYITSLYSQSSYYGVERIVDGMGNVRGFSYDYLMNEDVAQDNFYTCSNDIIYNDIRRISVPITALKSDTLFNVNGRPVVTKYEYCNALVHSDGHGFMGFEKMYARTYINGSILKKKEQGFEINTLKDNRVALPSYVREFNGENQLLKDKSMMYKKYSCRLNDKVIMPLQIFSYEYIFNPDKTNDKIKCNIVKNGYISDVDADGLYDNVVSRAFTAMGFDDEFDSDDVDDCKYMEKEVYTYKNNVEDWIVNRPSVICKYRKELHGEKIGVIKNYVYDDKVPTRIIMETKVPNCQNDVTDPLTTTIEYKYDKVGNVVEQSVASPSVEYKKVLRCEFGESYNYMYKTKSFDEHDREIKSDYDMDYGVLVSTTDFNGFTTLNDKDPLGINDVVTLPDGVVKAKVIRWSKNNEHVPQGATYYTWEKSTGMAETMVFYHKSGLELRSVSFDINGNAIYVDKKYDDYGNLMYESLPYLKGDDIYYVSTIYDKYNRLVEKKIPNGVACNLKYDGNTVITEYSSTDGKQQVKKETYNLMGWLVATVDVGGNEMLYEYYGDGLIKSAVIARNPNTKMTITYDNLGNRKTLYDPNYGYVSYEYNAFGNLMKVENPNGGMVEFKYDESGRMLSRNEKKSKEANVATTQWVYDDDKGKSGMLKKVVSDNHHIDYVYDSDLRLVCTNEYIKGVEYKTSYQYDLAGRISTITYPTGLRLYKVFSNSGYEKEIYDDEVMLWKTNETMPNGIVTAYQLGNDMMTSVSCNTQTYLIEGIQTSDKNGCIQHLTYDYDDWGNVLSREQLMNVKLYEEFEYDEQDRLVSIKLNGKNISNMYYDYQGNIVGKNELGVNLLYSTLYDKLRPNAIIKAKTDDEKMQIGFMRDVKFSTFDNVVSVSQGDNLLEIEYGCDNQKIYMNSIVNGMNNSKTYVGDCEFVEENGRSLMLTYINGPTGVFAVCTIDDKGNKKMNYIHKDNLGSWNIITDDNGDVVQNVAFDAWGNVRNGEDWSLDDTYVLMYDRGFTGHEHLDGFGLINMNGRMYDPLLSMMLSPDNNIQLPQMSQNFNRYSYCLNNPLKYTDPTGEWVESVVFGVAGGLVNLMTNAHNIDNFREGALAFGVGFVKGALAEYMMGQSWFVQVGVNTLMSGISSGVNQMISLGDGSFKFSGDDWNSIKVAAHYSLGNSLVNNVMFTYITQPTADQYGESFFEMCYNKELAYAITSVTAHGVGCWFSGQPFLTSMKFKDVGFDLKMLGIVAKQLLVSYINKTDFGDEAMAQRTSEIKESLMSEILSEDPDYPDFKCYYELIGVCVDKTRLYVVGNVFALLPGEMLEIYPKPYLEEIVSFPFSYSLFKSLFFNSND